MASGGGAPSKASSSRAKRGAPGLAHRRVTAGQHDRPQRRETLETAIVGEQELAAPGRAVGAPSGAVEGDADDGPLQVVLRHGAGHVGMMMLDADVHHIVPRERVRVEA